MSSLRFEMDGEWDLEDLAMLSTSLKLTYAYYYWIAISPEHVPQDIRAQISTYFWSGEYIGPRFNERLYAAVPHDARLRVISIQYNSPGWIEVQGAAEALKMAGEAGLAWVIFAERTLDLLNKIKKFFRDREIERIPKKVSLAKIGGATIDEARALCFEIGSALAFDDKRIEGLIELAGSPISALRMLAALANEARRTGDLEKAGKLKLPRR